MTGRAIAIVLAAGAGTRFGGGKLLASLEGRPLLRHVLDALAVGGIVDPVVVTSPDGELERGLEWGRSRRIVNPDPGRGLSSSLQVGWAAAMAAEPHPDCVIVVLGDQPLLDPAVIRALLDAPPDASRPIVVARHADGARNPVRLEPSAAPLVAAAVGDRGLGPLLDAHPELIRFLDVPALNPDIDVPGDLVAALETRWADRVKANADQVERFREAPDGRDFYATVSRTFIADPARDDDLVLDALLAIARPGDTWLDVGAGAGRYALPIARHVREVIAVDPSSSMLAALDAGATAHGIGNIQAIAGRWPADSALRSAIGPDPVADVVLISHVGYDIAAIEPFLEALERSARRTCVAVLMDQSPASVAAPFWPLVHGEDRVPLPALPQLVELLDARRVGHDVIRVTGERRRWADREEIEAFLRRQLWTRPGSPADGRLLMAIERLAAEAPDGGLTLPAGPQLDIGIVTWAPPESR